MVVSDSPKEKEQRNIDKPKRIPLKKDIEGNYKCDECKFQTKHRTYLKVHNDLITPFQNLHFSS